MISSSPQLGTATPTDPLGSTIPVRSYLFEADVGITSACTGLTASQVGTITRAGGKQQVAYNGHPVYLYVGDRKVGDVGREGVTAFGSAWYALTPAANRITSQPSSSTGNRSSGGSGASAY